jgi:CRISPR system Cascade subunit CasC
MSQNSNPYRNVRIEYHILQSFPVTCLNRDDVGAPKSAMVGGVSRARVSSQCWKRQVRLSLQELGIVTGIRTKLINDLVKAECEKQGATPAQAEACGSKLEQVFIKGSDSDKKVKKGDEDGPDDTADKTDTLLFLSPGEVTKIVEAFKNQGFDPNKVITQKDAKKKAQEVAKIIGKSNYAVDGLDIALFGRMVAQAATMNVEAAASFSHAISTHKTTNEVEFFTALDDLNKEQGSAHMGSLEFNAATYYRYISVDLGQLFQTLGGTQFIPTAIDKFTKALYLAVPSARQTTQSGASPWEFAKVYVRKGQRLQVPFETPVPKAKDGGFIEPSKKELRDYLTKKEKLSGSLFGKVASWDFGEDENFSIDTLAENLKATIAKVAA